MWRSASVCINFAERAGKAHREPHRRSQSNKTDERTKSDLGCQTEEQANKERVNREKGRNWIPIHCQKLNNDLLVRC